MPLDRCRTRRRPRPQLRREARRCRRGDFSLWRDASWLLGASYSFGPGPSPGGASERRGRDVGRRWLPFALAHLVALHGAFPAHRVRQTFAAAAAASHGGRVGVKERTFVCTHGGSFFFSSFFFAVLDYGKITDARLVC